MPNQTVRRLTSEQLRGDVSAEERAANPQYIILEYNEPIHEGNLNSVDNTLRHLLDRTDLMPDRIYAAYSDGFGHLIETKTVLPSR